MRKPIDSTGFTAPAGRALGRERRTVALAELIAIVGLALSTIVAATVVSVGIARADVAGNVIDNEGSVFTVALLLGLIFIAMGGLTVLRCRPQAEKALVPSIHRSRPVRGELSRSAPERGRFYADAFFFGLAYPLPKGGGKVRCRYEPKVEIS